MLPFRGPPAPPPRGFLPPPPIAAGRGAPLLPHGMLMMRGPPPPQFAPRPLLPPHRMAQLPPGVAPLGPPGVALQGPPGVNPVGPPGVTVASANGADPVGVAAAAAEDAPPVASAQKPAQPFDAGAAITVFVGQLPSEVHDSHIRQLLEKCGTVLKWRRAVDPVADKPLAFGYCTFSKASDVLCALRLLDGRAVASREIVIRADTKVQGKLEALRDAKSEQAKADECRRDAAIEQALKKVVDECNKLRSARQLAAPDRSSSTLPEKAAAPPAAVNSSKTQELEARVPPATSEVNAPTEVPVVAPPTDASSSESEASSVQALRTEAPVAVKVRSPRSSWRWLVSHTPPTWQEETNATSSVVDAPGQLQEPTERGPERRDDAESSNCADTTKELADVSRTEKAASRPSQDAMNPEEPSLDRTQAPSAVAKRKNSAVESDRHDGDREAPASSHHHKRERKDRSREERKKRDTRARSRSRSESRDRDRDRDRRRRDRSRSRSRSRSRERSSRRRHRRSRSRSRSRSQSPDRRRRRKDRDSDGERRKSRRHRRRGSSSDTDRSDDEKRKRSSKRHRKSSASPESEKTQRDSVGKIEDAAAESSVDPPAEQQEVADAEAAAPKVMPKIVLGLKKQSGASKKDKPATTIPIVSAFAVEEEVEAKPVRELVPLDYTEEEKLAGASVQQRVAATVARINSRSGDVKSLIEQIPVETNALFAFPVDWKAVDQHNIVKEKMAPWVKKKIVEYLGEEEATMVEFVLRKLAQRAPAREILGELQLVLDDAAEEFVKLLWRKLAFEAVRCSISAAADPAR